MKKSDQMKALLAVMITASTELMNKDGVTAAEINAKAAEIETLKAKIAMQETIEAQERADFDNVESKEVVAGSGKSPEALYKEAFYNAIAGRKLSAEHEAALIQNALSSTTGEDGGYLIPVDQQVAIKELKRQLKPLEELVNVETVTTLTGSRNIEKDAEHTPFANLAAEGDTIADTDTPQFVNIPYSIKDYSGILPMSNNLLADNAANLQAYLNRWLAKKDVATRNKLIVTALNTLTKTAVTGLDEVKTALNVTLDPAIADGSIIIMNQDSFNKFDQMKDKDDKPLLQPMPTDATKKMLAGKEVRVYSNKTLPTRSATVGEVTTKYAPVIIGNLKEVVTLFDRQQMSLLSTNIGAGAFEKNQTKTRAILRLDVAKVDTSAAVFGEIVV